MWDFPRPPRLEPVDWQIRVVHASATIVDAPGALRVLETSQLPAYYVAPEWVANDLLVVSSRTSFCEWKGQARYADVVVGDVVVADAAWSYPSPTSAFAPLRDFWAFYAQKLDQCFVDDELVAPNPGSFYGGWATANVVGPFKGGPGTMHW